MAQIGALSDGGLRIGALARLSDDVRSRRESCKRSGANGSPGRDFLMGTQRTGEIRVESTTTSGQFRLSSGQYRAMIHGERGIHGDLCNVYSVSYGAREPLAGSNPTLTARIKSM